MHIIKKTLRWFASYFFKLFILLVAVVAALVMTFHSPDKIEKSLRDSGVYSTFVDSALQEVEKAVKDNPNNSEVPIADPAIKTAANQAFTPQLLQSSTESVLNGTFDWLAGKTAEPKFKIDLTNAKQTFANGVGAAAATRVKGLPTCTTTQIQQLNADMDPFALICQPPGFDITAAQTKVTSDIANSKEFLGTPLITPQTMPKDSKGNTIFDNLSKAPDVYKLINASPWLLGLLALIFGALTLVLYESKRKGLRSLAFSLTGVGVFLLIISFINNYIFHKLNQPSGALGKSLPGNFQQTGIKAAGSISDSIQSIIIWFGLSYLILGLGIFIALHFTKKDEKPKAPPKEEKSNEDEPKPVEPDKPPAPKPRPRPLVQ